MLQRFYPDEYLDSTYVIDFDKLYEEGYRGIIFDIDNTLVPHGAPADERAKKLFAHLKELGYHCMLLSNNKEPRVKMFNDAVNVSYIYKAGKPSAKNYLKAMEEKSLKAIQERGKASVGDKTMVDALAPAVEAMQQHYTEGLEKMLEEAEAGALRGVENTKDCIARFGRAKSLGERALGFQDAGATSTWLIFQSMREFVKGE